MFSIELTSFESSSLRVPNKHSLVPYIAWPTEMRVMVCRRIGPVVSSGFEFTVRYVKVKELQADRWRWSPTGYNDTVQEAPCCRILEV